MRSFCFLQVDRRVRFSSTKLSILDSSNEIVETHSFTTSASGLVELPFEISIPSVKAREADLEVFGNSREEVSGTSFSL